MPRRETLSAIDYHILLHTSDRCGIGRAGISADILFIRLVPDWRLNGTRRYDDDVDAEWHQFTPQSICITLDRVF